MRNELARFLQARAATDDKLVLLTGDLGFSVLEPVREALGARFLNVGVAEASMTTMAAAIASEGFRVFTYSITPFATLRCLEQIRNDICYHELDVTVVGVGAGYGYGALGPTHHATEDLAALWSIPNLTVYSPGDVREAKACFEHAWNQRGPKYLRLGKGGEGNLSTEPVPDLEASPILQYATGSDLTIVTTGGILNEVLEANRTLAAEGLSAQVLTVPYLKPFPAAALVEKIQNDRVTIVEELNPYGGFSSQCTHAMLTLAPGRWKKVSTLSAADRFAKVAGGLAYQRKMAGLDSGAVAKIARELVGIST